MNNVYDVLNVMSKNKIDVQHQILYPEFIEIWFTFEKKCNKYIITDFLRKIIFEGKKDEFIDFLKEKKIINQDLQINESTYMYEY